MNYQESRLAVEKSLRARVNEFETIEDPRIQVLTQFIGKYVDLKQLNLDYIARYVLFTYRSQHCENVPVLIIRGDHGSGKTRLLMTICSLCYRPIVANATWTAKTLSRKLDKEFGTLILDEYAHRSKQGRYTTVRVIETHRRHPAIIATHMAYHGFTHPYAYHIQMLRSDAAPVSLGPDFHSELQQVRDFISL